MQNWGNFEGKSRELINHLSLNATRKGDFMTNIVEFEGKAYITKQEFCKLCGISEKMAYKLIKSEKIHFEKCRDGLLHYYKIPIEDAWKYIESRKKNVSDENVLKISTYYRNRMKHLPDAITTKDIQEVTGYGQEAIRKWIVGEKLIGVVSRKRFIIAKEDLIDFLVSPAYVWITRKSKIHIDDFKKLGII